MQAPKMKQVFGLFVLTCFYCTVVNTIPFMHYGYCRSNLSERAVCLPLEDCEFYKPLSDYKQTEICVSSNPERSLICCSRTSGSSRLTTGDSLESSTATASIVETRSSAPGVLLQPPYCGLMLSDRIYGGNETNLDEHPWMALLDYDTPVGRGFHCGGSLIHERWVLTAAHCITGRGLRDGWSVVGVRLGEWNIDFNPDCITDHHFGSEDCAPGHIDVPIDLQLPHPDFDSYKPNVPNDIALLRLQHSVRWSQFVKPICLPTEPTMREHSFAGTTAEVCGWGRTQDGDRPSKVKLKAQLEVRGFEDCAREYQKYRIALVESQMCAGGVLGVDACRGDSGGPLVLEWSANKRVGHYQIGVVSLGKIRCGSSATPGIYTRVGPYIDWIAKKISEN